MLLIILALIWVALLTPVVVRRLREGGAERSIESFHAEHEVLTRQDYRVIPVHRLDEPDQMPVHEHVTERRPRLTVVHPDDTFGTLESRTSWDEWSEDYEYDADAPRYEATHEVTNHYARAYSSHPRAQDVTVEYQAPIRRRPMRVQRRIIFSRLVLCAVLLTLIAFFVGSVVVDLAALAWFSVVFYVALALYAVSQGYLSDTSLPLRSRQRPLATVKPLYREPDEGYIYPEDEIDDEFYEEVYEPEVVLYWDREPERRRALG